MKIFLKNAVLFALFGLMACGGNSKDTLGPGDSDEITAGTMGICNRTPKVRDAILTVLSDIDNCALVTKAHLSSITRLDLNGQGITDLRRADFGGLDNLPGLSLSFNSLSTLKEGVFSGLSSLKSLDLSFNSLHTLPAGVFSGLDSLRWLGLDYNSFVMLQIKLDFCVGLISYKLGYPKGGIHVEEA